MFPILPQLRELTLVCEMPQQLRIGRRSDWADRNLGGAVFDAFLEGPVFDSAGNLFLVDIAFGRILTLDRSGHWEVVTAYDGWPNGLKLVAERTFLVADNKRGLIAIDRDSGQLRALCEGWEGRPFHGLNDLTLSGTGDIYFTDQGVSGLQDPHGRLFRLRPSGELQLVLSGIPSPNGLVLSADERTLFLAVTRANAVWRVPLDPEGRAYKVGTFIQMSGGIGPDGVARPQGGDGLVVAQPGLGVWQLAEDGVARFFWRRPGFDFCTNLAEDPLQPGSFWITESKRAAILRMTVE